MNGSSFGLRWRMGSFGCYFEILCGSLFVWRFVILCWMFLRVGLFVNGILYFMKVFGGGGVLWGVVGII